MIEGLTRNAARNIFFGGSILLLSGFSGPDPPTVIYYVITTSTDHAGLTDSVKQGKHIWEENSCINCHSLLGEGAYFAPELGNVWQRFGGESSPEGARNALKAWIRIQPTGAPGRRQMPAYDFTEEELDALIDFLEWTSRIDTQGWPAPNIFRLRDQGESEAMNYQTQKVAYPFFVIALILFTAQVLFGVVAGAIYLWPNLLTDVMPLSYRAHESYQPADRLAVDRVFRRDLLPAPRKRLRPKSTVRSWPTGNWAFFVFAGRGGN